LSAHKDITAFHLAGRIAVKHQEQGFSGSLRWSHDSGRDEVLLQSPLGQGVARIVRDADGVALTAADEQTYRAASVEALTQQTLGWPLPLRGLEHWVLGRAAPGGAAREILGADGHLSRLVQDGWQVDLERYQPVRGTALPGRLEAVYGNEIEVRLVIDHWELPE
jgi:outer membrane lipoprotein LolB